MIAARAVPPTSEVDSVNRPVDPKISARIKEIRLREVESDIRFILGQGGYKPDETNSIVAAVVALLRGNEKVSPETLYRRMKADGVADSDARMMSRDFAF